MSDGESSPAHDTWAVVTVFRPDRVPPLLDQVRSQVAAVVVVDDGSGPEHTATLKDIARTGAVLVSLDHNSGIGSALNRGIQRAFEGGAGSIVTFDQDSEISPEFVAELRFAHDRARADDLKVGPVVPEYFAEVRQSGDHLGGDTFRASHAIQSGMYIPAAVLGQVGMLDEGLFIDLVDVDFELRCEDAGLPCIIAQGVKLDHHLGARYRFPGLFRTLLPTLTLSTPFRYYYRARNRIIINRRHSRHHWRRLLRETVADQLYFLITLALANPRRSMHRVLRAGKAAGREGQSGPMPSDLAVLAASISWRAEPQEE